MIRSKLMRFAALTAFVSAPLIFFTPQAANALPANSSCGSYSWYALLGANAGCSTTAECPSWAVNGCYFDEGVNVSGYGIVWGSVSSTSGLSDGCGWSYFACGIGDSQRYVPPGWTITTTCWAGGDTAYVQLQCFNHMIAW